MIAIVISEIPEQQQTNLYLKGLNSTRSTEKKKTSKLAKYLVLCLWTSLAIPDLQFLFSLGRSVERTVS